MFVRQLLQLKGVSVDRAVAIANRYSTPKLLRAAYAEGTQNEGEKLLSSIKYGSAQKNIGIVISRSVYQLYTRQQF